MASDDETASHLNPTGAARRRRRLHSPPPPPASISDRLTEFRVPPSPTIRRHGSSPPTEPPASRHRSPTPPVSRGAESLRRLPGGSPTPSEDCSLLLEPVVNPAAANHFPRRHQRAVTWVPRVCSMTADASVHGSIFEALTVQPGSPVASGGRAQSSAASSHDREPQLTTATPLSAARPPALTASELGFADVVMCYRSIVMLIFMAVMVYYERNRPVVLVSEIAGMLCLYLHFWSSHIKQFWLLRPYGEDSSVIVLLWCFTLCMLAFVVGVNVSPLAGMGITCFATICMVGFLAGCIREYNHTKHSLEFMRPLGSDLHERELSEGSCIVREAPPPRKLVPVHMARKTPMFSRKSTTSAKPAWK